MEDSGRQGPRGAPVEWRRLVAPTPRRWHQVRKKVAGTQLAPTRLINTDVPGRLKTVLLTPLAREPWQLPASARPQGTVAAG